MSVSRVEYDAARVREAIWDVERRPQRGPYLTTAERLTLAALDLKGPPSLKGPPTEVTHIVDAWGKRTPVVPPAEPPKRSSLEGADHDR